MNKMIVLIFALLVTTSSEAKTKTQNFANIKSESNPGNAYSFSQYLNYEARPGAGIVSGFFTIGANLEGKYGFKFGSNTLFVGIETGFFRTGVYSDNFQSASITSIPITPSATFEFPVSKSVKLYSGASLGVAIATGHQSYTDGFGNSNSFSSTSGLFMWKFRPGLVVSDKFVAELPIGTSDGSFYFLPNVGYRF
jgi:hypothetical protein